VTSFSFDPQHSLPPSPNPFEVCRLAKPSYFINCGLSDLNLNPNWYAHMGKGELNGVVFLDIRKAFDSINHKILLNKLETQFGISNNELNWFKNLTLRIVNNFKAFAISTLY
jgi:hypothetical protein